MKRNETGSSILEIITSIAMTAAIVATIYPLFSKSSAYLRRAEFQDQCINAARAKLNEYKSGRLIDFPSLAAPYNLLTSETGSGQTAPNGFAYAKWRYNVENAAYCPSAGALQPKLVTSMPPSDLTDLGRRECVVESQASAAAATNCAGASSVDDQMLSTTQGRFKLFVNLRRYNALVGPAATNGIAEDCFSYTQAGVPLYDFQQAGDAIKITVTGLVDFTTPGVPAVFAGDSVSAAQQGSYTCQISDFIRPHSHIARYWLQTDGHLFRWLGTGVANQFEVFPTLASSANHGISVSPDNKFIYILRPGTLIRYEGCTGEPIDCPTASQRTWKVDSNIVSITAKWVGTTSHKPNSICGSLPDLENGWPVIFGLLSDHKSAVCLDIPGAAKPAADADPVDLTGSAFVVPDTAGGPRIPFQIPQQTSRVHSIFGDARAANAFVVDLSCSNSLSANNTYCGGIYSTNDTYMIYPLETFNLRAIAFSK